MTYLTYGPSPTSHYRIVCTPGDSLFASPLDCATDAASRCRARATSRAALRTATLVAIVPGVAAAALALRISVYAVAHSGVLF
jgi:hypothetical protein